MATSISLTSGAQTYIYGQVTGGARPCSALANGSGDTVDDTNGYLCVGLAVTDQPSNSFTFNNGNFYAISGVGVSGFTNMQALYAQNVISAPGNVDSGTFPTSLDFTLTEPALVVAMALGSGQEGLAFQGPSELVTDYATTGISVETPLAAGIAHAYLDPGSYTIEADASVTAPQMTLDNMADLLGVYVFTVPEPGTIGLMALAIVGTGMRRRRAK
jgi:hypothetical protein